MTKLENTQMDKRQFEVRQINGKFIIVDAGHVPHEFYIGEVSSQESGQKWVEMLTNGETYHPHPLRRYYQVSYDFDLISFKVQCLGHNQPIPHPEKGLDNLTLGDAIGVSLSVLCEYCELEADLLHEGLKEYQGITDISFELPSIEVFSLFLREFQVCNSGSSMKYSRKEDGSYNISIKWTTPSRDKNVLSALKAYNKYKKKDRKIVEGRF